MDQEILHKHILIVEKTKPLLKLLEGKDYDCVKDIHDESKKFIEEYDWENRTISNPTNKELGALKQGLSQSLVNAKKSNIKGFIKEKYLDQLTSIINELNFSKELIDSKILLMRKRDWFERTDLENELNSYLLEEFKREFLQNNPKILKDGTGK